ncbi:MAG: class E sortase [Actinobacteria bacterium]|nr:class E sortase [Actinomycetota bacterium]MSX16581.1 class E sortase [Actinomycetota bacterium]MSX36449.1 class E sortase [Actinomycetota bacterium]MSX78362.1 class E sortase [Actinomycetota bacterium]MSZ72491.1 class E sortase [Actinomycetota bacterium]
MENDESGQKHESGSSGFGSSEFGGDLTPPDHYDPFETSRPIPRPTDTGPIEPLLIPSNNGAELNATPLVKVPFWDRPKPKKDWYWFLGRLGSSLITLGLLMFLFVGYQLWGTGIEEAQSQNKLENRFSEIAILSSATSSTSLAPSNSEPPVTTTLAPPEPIVVNEGDPIAIIDMPTIGVTKYVVAGVQTADLKKGPGHYPGTPFPGELGNASIAGHRTTYGEPFRHLDDLNLGDPIIITDLLGRQFTYLVTNQQVVGATDSWVVATTDRNKAILTLTTCHPEFSAKQRLIISAELDLTQSDIATSPAAMYADEVVDTTTVPSTEVVTSEVAETTTVPAIIVDESNNSESADALSRGWFSDLSAIPQTLLWGLLELLVVMGAWQVAKKYRNRIIGTAVGFIPFFIVLYFVFQNVNRLLPPNL